ncbi:MAG: flagellar biosynthesis protein FlhA [Clostridia bacterium]|nr:flagellar biosynthesis protein FlhA [Clostridia bacterium]
MSRQSVLAKGIKYSDIAVASIVILSIMIMVIKVPPQVLDVMITVNISISLVILLVAMYVEEPLDFSVFPTLLLIITLFRLSLNVATTRLILLQGENSGGAGAGHVIETFGNFVLGGNAIVGFVIFLILVVIQFLVITKGSERVSEVAARFTLDAMPGKQMSIDADLNSGLINEQDAKARRNKIQREADFYGAMDGASKFVKGDAIAAIVIIIINIIGGFIIGMLMKGMAWDEALSRFTLLSIGDGLVAQIPALLISTATGIVVTRAGSETNLGQELIGQIFARPKALYLAAAMLVLLALMGLPKAPFLILAGVLILTAYSNQNRVKQLAQQEADLALEKEVEETRKPENVVSLLNVDTMELDLGYSLIPLVDVNQGGDLLDRVIMIRRQCALEMGIILPPIRMRDNMQLKPNTYSIKIKGVEVANGIVMVDHYLAMSSGLEEDGLDGIETVEPAFGLPAKWIHSSLKEQAELSGYTVVDPPSVVATHLTEVIKTHAHEILGRQDVQSLIDNIKQTYPAVVEELIPNLMTIGEIQKVLANLLLERVPIRDLVTILETLADNARLTKDPEMLTEYVRQALARQITKLYVSGSVLHVISLDPALEQTIRESIQHTEHGSYVAMEPNLAQNLFNNLGQAVEQVKQQGFQPVVLCSPVVRIYFKRLTERFLPGLVVLSYNELDSNLEVQSVGMVSI